MIYLLFLIDIIINNYTAYTSYFFIISLYNKPYKHYLIIGLVLDLIIFNTFFINTLIMTILYFMNKIFSDLNKENIINYAFINLFNYLIFIILSNLFMHNNINNILINIGSNLLINIIFYLLSYRIRITIK